jgi:hypothetical protein
VAGHPFAALRDANMKRRLEISDRTQLIRIRP